jgi:hypothetical protein
VAEKEKKRRLRLRFRLGCLLAALAVLAVPLAIIGNWRRLVHQRQDAWATLQRRDALVYFHYEVDSSSPSGYSRWNDPPGPEWVRSWVGDLAFARAHSVFCPPDFHNRDIILLRPLTELQTLYLGGTRISDTGLEDLSRLPQIKTLNLQSIDVSDEGVKSIAEISDLEQLSLNYTPLTDKSLQHLASLPNLRFLALHGTDVTGGGIARLKSQRPLLDVSWSRAPTPEHRRACAAMERLGGFVMASGNAPENVSYEAQLENYPFALGLHFRNWTGHDDDLAALKHIKNLTKLSLHGAQITDAGLQHLTELSDLRSLDLSSTEVSDDGVAQLAALAKLRVLNLRGTHVSAQAVEKLQRALPRCEIRNEDPSD